MGHKYHIPGGYHPLSGKVVPHKSIVTVVTSNAGVVSKDATHRTLRTIRHGIWQDFLITNKSSASRVSRLVGGAMIGGPVHGYFESLSPLKWALRGFGPLPYEFGGGMQVFELTAGARIVRVLVGAGATATLTAVAYEGGVLIGSTINQFLPESVKDDIGGTINEVINEGGYKELWKHPFGIGM